MNKIHIALGVDNIAASIDEYNQRMGQPACVVVAGEYALWRTQGVNFSIRKSTKEEVGKLRHLGWEDETAPQFTKDTDVNGIVWERFNAEQQTQEIKSLWANAEIAESN